MIQVIVDGGRVEFSDLVRTTRKEKHSSTKLFYDQAELSCSYFYYTKVEKDTLPSVDLAIEILQKLNIPTRKGLYSWVRSQMPSHELKAMFTEMDDLPSRSEKQDGDAPTTVVINRMQAKLLKQDATYWELLVFLNCYFNEKVFTLPQISSVFSLPEPKLKEMLENLFDHGLVDKDSRGRFVTREWSYIPYSEEFEGIRDTNLRRAMDRFLSVKQGRRIRTTITRLVTEEQEKEIAAKIVALTNAIIDMPDEKPPKAKPFTLGIFGSARKFSND